MSAEYTPTTAEVQRSYTETIRLGQSSDEWMQEAARKVAEFDRWLAAHEHELRERIAQDIEAEGDRWAATSAVGHTAAYVHAARIARGATR